MFLVTVYPGARLGFDVNIDRVPVAGDNILYQNKNYTVQRTWMLDGGGSYVAAEIQGADAKAPVKKGAASTAKKAG